VRLADSRRNGRSPPKVALSFNHWGTCAALRDITPEAVRSVMRVELPDFGEVMRAGSLKLTPNTILSRSLVAIVDRSLAIALPGKPQGAVDCLGFVAGAIPHSTSIAQQMPTANRAIRPRLDTSQETIPDWNVSISTTTNLAGIDARTDTGMFIAQTPH